MAAFLVLGAALLAGPGERSLRESARFDVVAIDRDVLYVYAAEPMEGLQLAKLAERYDYYVEWSPDRKSARVLLYTAAPMLSVQVDLNQDKSGRLKRRQSLTVVNPLKPNWRD